MSRRTRATDPYSILDQPGRRRHPLLVLLVPLLVLVGYRPGLRRRGCRGLVSVVDVTSQRGIDANVAQTVREAVERRT